LSGGQRQRVALARALVRDPRAFLMDEPLSNLDAKLRAETRTELVALHERLGKTIVFVTHDQVEAMTMADRIAILVDGRLQQVGTPEEIYAGPANVFVARFIGSPPMNTWPGSLTPELAGGGRVPEHVIVGVRPEDIGLGGDGLAATAVGVESLGHERLVTCELVGAETATVRLDGKQAYPQVGETVHLVPDPAEVVRFDAATGERLP
ncbi:MAG: ABC transporter ATP-binding protein, partial [Acidimicrobiia bacterium]|nr:ABC transporter ATP-binding protein [Acidimicrobiia bacterium]